MVDQGSEYVGNRSPTQNKNCFGIKMCTRRGKHSDAQNKLYYLSQDKKERTHLVALQLDRRLQARGYKDQGHMKEKGSGKSRYRSKKKFIVTESICHRDHNGGIKAFETADRTTVTWNTIESKSYDWRFFTYGFPFSVSA